jgi:hypothetical protein
LTEEIEAAEAVDHLEDHDLAADVHLAEVHETLVIEEIERCIMPYVVTAEKTAKCHSSQQEVSLFCVAIVLQKTVTQSHDDLVIVEIAHQDMILHHEKVEAHRLTTSN